MNREPHPIRYADDPDIPDDAEIWSREKAEAFLDKLIEQYPQGCLEVDAVTGEVTYTIPLTGDDDGQDR